MGKKVHFLGIGGSGASAAAAIAQAQGYEVTGCDLKPHNEFTTIFKRDQLLTGHNPKHLASHITRGLIAQGSGNVDILTVTPAIFSLDPNNPELLEAKKKNIPVMTWQQFVGEYLAKDKFIIAVCGTHGKTTTTAMIGLMLEEAGLDPTVELGGIVPNWGTSYRLPRQKHHAVKYFVLEADEFNDNFLSHKPEITVVTNIEMDHPEYFKDFEAVKESFKRFLIQTKTTVANLTDSGVSEVMKAVMKTPLRQTSSGLPVRPTSPRGEQAGRGINETYLDYSKNELNFSLKIPGEFNKSNAQAALQVGLILGIDPQTIQKSLSNYTGVGRRFEYIGEYNEAQIYSDFGHHPTEIKVTMEAARQEFPEERILLIFQPHMFSRTKTLFDDFVKVFKKIPVDKIIITDIYPSREIDTGKIHSKQLVESINYDTLEYHSKKQLPKALKKEIQKNDIVFFMGAGDIDKLAKEFVRSN